MAPEILVPTQRLEAATFEDLKKVDIWAFGMVLFNLLNPDMKYPYQLDIKESGKSSAHQVQEFVTRKILPTSSAKYKDLQNTIWNLISKEGEKCLQFDPCLRPSATTLKETFQVQVKDCVEREENDLNEGKLQTISDTRYEIKSEFTISLCFA